MCFAGGDWKREVVQDHKFDFIDTRDYHSKSFGVRVRYIFLYVLIVKSFMVYMSDIFTAVTMLSSDGWTNQIYAKCGDECAVQIQFDVAKWIFVGCIIFSFLLLAYEAYKAKKIIASRDISYAFTNVMANTYYSLRSYDHYCFFCQIENSTKKKDDFAFFIFFTFKGWKRLLLADGPRQSINGLILYSFWRVNNGSFNFEDYVYSNDPLTSALFFTMLFTVLVFAGSVLLLIVAAICYVPLLCYIQGNLKEYCCHKVDKRIAELIKRKNKLRLRKQAQLARKEAAGDFSHLKDKNGQIVAPTQPTLPDIDVDDEPTPTLPMRRGLQPPYAGGDQYWGHEPKGADGYSMYSGYAPPTQPYFHGTHNGRPDSYYDGASDYGSTAHLAPGYGQIPPVPMGDPRMHSPGSAVGPGFYHNDPRYAYPQEHGQYHQEQYMQTQAPQYQAGDRRSHGSGLAYDEPDRKPDGYNQSQSGLPAYDNNRGGKDGYGGGYAM
ncbi:Fungal potassium channel, partial [Rhizoctonia solani]